MKRSELCPQNCSSGVKQLAKSMCEELQCGIGCCGSEPYNEDQCCDDNDEITHKTRKCPANCTGQSFDPLTHKCCGGRTIWELNRDCPSVCDDDNRSLTPRESLKKFVVRRINNPENVGFTWRGTRYSNTLDPCVLR